MCWYMHIQSWYSEMEPTDARCLCVDWNFGEGLVHINVYLTAVLQLSSRGFVAGIV